MALTSGDLGNDKELGLVPGYGYRFGQFVLDSRKRTLFRADSPVSLTPRAFDVLLFLVQNPNRLVTKEELLQAVWGDTFVEEGNLTQYIWHLRKALGDKSEDSRFIVTIARKGYQFTADVAIGETSDTATQAVIRVLTADGTLRDPQTALHNPAGAPVPITQGHWRKGVILRVSAAFLVIICSIIGFVFWRHFTGIRPPTSRKIMLAVLPFENLTGDPNKEYLADGLTEEMISQLGRLNPDQLGVIARTSVMGYKHKNQRLDQIARELSVQYVLENSLRENGDHLRLTAQLIQMKDQTHLWAKDYDYPANDILKVQDDVAKTVALEIKLRLTSQQQGELALSHPVKPEAFDAYLQGYYFFERNTDKDTEMAAKYYERATQLDPSYALAWAGLSRVRKWQAARGLIPTEEGYRLARQAAEKALSLDPNLAEAHNQMGRIQQQVDFDWAGANASFERAVELDPGNPESLGLAAFSATILGRMDRAISLNRRAVDIDPLNAMSWEVLGETKYFSGQLDEAIPNLKKALELDPDLWNGHIFLSKVYIGQGRPQDALPEIERVRFDFLRGYLYAIAYHALGQTRKSDTALTELLTKYQANNACLIAQVYAFRNQPDEAFQWLGRAYAERDEGLIDTKVEPFLRNLHKDPRYDALLKNLNLPN